MKLYDVFCLLILGCVFHAGAVLAGDAVTPPVQGLQPQLGPLFRDNAVLQQNMRLPVWGKTLPGARVTVAVDGQEKSVQADGEGNWRTVLDPMEAVALMSVNDSPAGKTMVIKCERDGLEAVREIQY